MADVKISALPAATTPLTGSEVLPIVQNGTTDQVSVANLTAGRSVSGLSFSASGAVSGATVTASGAVSGATAIIGAGTVTEPSITTTGDGNTGIFFPAADTIAFTEGGVESLRLNNSGNAIFAGTVAMASSFLRNRLINGSVVVDQRNVGASQTFTAGAALAYSVDRWYGYCTGANVTGQRVSGAVANTFRYQFTGAASVTSIGFGQRIEALNSADLAGTTCTLSVDLANSLLTTVTWTAFYANTTDTFGSLASPTRTQIATGTFTVTSTVTRYSTTISVPSAATTGIEIVFTVGAQTSGTWTLGNMQFEAGTASTSFERRQFGQELGLCQRYFYRLTAATNFTNFGGGRAYASTDGQVFISVPVSMRGAPTGSISAIANFNATTVGPITAINPVAAYSGDFRHMTVNITAPYVDGQTIALNANNTTAAWMAWAAEL